MQPHHEHDYRVTERNVSKLNMDIQELIRHVETELRIIRVRLAGLDRRITVLEESGRIELSEEFGE